MNCIFVLLKDIVDTDTPLVSIVVNGGIVSRYLLLEAIQGMPTLENFGNEILVNDMTLKLQGGHFLAMTKLEVLSEKGSSIKLLATAYAGKFLIDLVELMLISNCSSRYLYRCSTHQLDVEPQPRSRLELLSAYAASPSVVIRSESLVLRQVVVRVEVFVALVAIVMHI